MDRKDKLNKAYGEYIREVISKSESKNLQAFKAELFGLSEFGKKVARLVDLNDNESLATFETFLSSAKRV
jgi:hypothetical protein